VSKIVKGVGKVFKKVAKVVKKVAPIVVAAAAIYFTGGAALGLLPAGMTAGAAATGALGLTGTLGGVVSGAITTAGYGALAGGVISGATGGNVMKGMQMGALTGAVTGGVAGGINSTMASAATPTAGSTLPQPPAGLDAHAIDVGVREGMWAAPSTVPGSTATGGGLLSQGGWLERNQTLAGNVISGVGQGLMAGSEADAERDLLREKYKLQGRNYQGANPNKGYRQMARGNGVAPSERFDTRFGYEYKYDPQQGRIVRVPIA
jgi:hypothetical protein